MDWATPDMPVKKFLTNLFRAAFKVRGSDPKSWVCLVINSITEFCDTDDQSGPVLEQAVLRNWTLFEQLLNWVVVQGVVDLNSDLHAKALAMQNLLIRLNAMCKVIEKEDDLWLNAKATLIGLELYDE